MRRAVYAGSFDPITNGHLWMIREAAKLFDELVVAIGINPDKTYTFDLETRLDLIRQCTGGIPNITVSHFENLYLAHYAKDVNADFIVRGIRSVSDYEYEKGMRHINEELEGEVSSVFLIPPREISEISSSFIKGMVGPDDWEQVVHRYVPECVFKLLVKHHE